MLAIHLVIIQVVTFGILIWVLKRIFYNDLGIAKKRLAQLNRQNIDKEKELKLKAETAEMELKRFLEEANEDAQKIRSEARKDAEKIAINTRETVEREKDSMLLRTKERCKKIEENLDLKMEKISVGMACEMVKNVFTEAVRKNIHICLINELIDDIQEIERDRIDVHTDNGKVMLPFPISDEQKRRLEEALTFKSGKKISLHEEIDENLVLGMKLNLDGLIIDGTLKNRLDKIKVR